ncbi:formate dehydrogenase subunit alpha [Thermococcus sp. M39]|uniref:formate dehydrogenase subunit alpha n=1 Tax=Thermococcus sp. M39 TaxID=1638262 RepID=UPI001439C3F2|nr:formate dehydrogenase subunit alpha [Thermococcus sp. M39]NJE07663.1 formate dehydrogenase subunit alpha [Thermococcus sp. M39]
MAEKLVPVVCAWCSVGCRLYIVNDSGYPKRIEFDYDHYTVNNGKLCPKGVASFQYLRHPDRLKKPLKRVGERGEGKFVEISWEEAIKEIAQKLKEIKEKYGPDALAFLGTERISVEANYVLQKLARALGTNNVEHPGRFCQSTVFFAKQKILGNPFLTNPFEDITKTKAILIWGYNPAATSPVFFGQYVEKAILDNGAKLIVVDPRKTETAKFADIHIQPYPGTDLAVALAMLNVIIKNELYDKDFIAERVEGFEELAKKVEQYTPRWAEKISGVPAELIEKAAITFATAGKGALLQQMGSTQHANGTLLHMALAALIVICGYVGKEGVMSGAIPGAYNAMGVSIMGVDCDMLPGRVSVEDEEEVKRIEEIWGFKIPRKPGLTYFRIIEAINEGKVKALYIVGVNPAKGAPNSAFVREALKKAEFIVVQDVFPNETAQYADIVLPAAAWYEQEGTIMSFERRVQRSFKAADPPGDAKPDWQIIVEVARALGLGEYFNYSSVDDILREINRAVPILAGATPERLKENIEGCIFPCPDEKTETPRLFLDGFMTPDGKAHLIPVDYEPPGEVPDEEYPFWLTNFTLVGQFRTGVRSFRSRSLEKRWPEPFVMINVSDAAKLGIKTGDLVKVETRRGSLTARAEVTPNIREGVIAMPWHWDFNYLTTDVLDKYVEMPELKTAACRISKVKG